jgi:Type II secretion system (T2SS), protein M
MFDRLTEIWERMASRERRLAVLGGFAVVAILVAVVIGQVWDGLTALEEENDAKREAIRTMEEKREDLIAARGRTDDPVAKIGDEAPPLGSYLERISTEVGVKVQKTRPLPGTNKGKFHEVGLHAEFYDLTLEQLAKFLKRVETDSQVVVTTRLFVKRSTSQKEKLDRVELSVTTYEKAKAQKPKTAAAGDKEKKEEAP